MIGTTMPQMTQNTLVIHHHHSMHKTVRMVRTVGTLVTPVIMMGTTMPQTAQNKLTIHHCRSHSMYETVRVERTAATMAYV